MRRGLPFSFIPIELFSTALCHSESTVPIRHTFSLDLHPGTASVCQSRWPSWPKLAPCYVFAKNFLPCPCGFNAVAQRSSVNSPHLNARHIATRRPAAGFESSSLVFSQDKTGEGGPLRTVVFGRGNSIVASAAARVKRTRAQVSKCYGRFESVSARRKSRAVNPARRPPAM